MIRRTLLPCPLLLVALLQTLAWPATAQTPPLAPDLVAIPTRSW